ncbi:DUF6356 family protein [Marinivivus vitaminiproducens]|uniref:DUF6356 family protein n=1 Tax=Marinivivus vitaminiproducens TaxID=3035935 RepID=UPI0027A82A6F|nr:DUF6356 family protein [Geminicoccaceae bacterium SCSIO 64248]
MTKISFTEHPQSVGECYLQHLRHAWSFACPMFAASIACFVHGLLPFLFLSTGSSTIRRLHDRMVVNRADLSSPSETPTVRSRRHVPG